MFRRSYWSSLLELWYQWRILGWQIWRYRSLYLLSMQSSSLNFLFIFLQFVFPPILYCLLNQRKFVCSHKKDYSNLCSHNGFCIYEQFLEFWSKFFGTKITTSLFPNSIDNRSYKLWAKLLDSVFSDICTKYNRGTNKISEKFFRLFIHRCVECANHLRKMHLVAISTYLIFIWCRNNLPYPGSIKTTHAQTILYVQRSCIHYDDDATWGGFTLDFYTFMPKHSRKKIYYGWHPIWVLHRWSYNLHGSFSDTFVDFLGSSYPHIPI